MYLLPLAVTGGKPGQEHEDEQDTDLSRYKLQPHRHPGTEQVFREKSYEGRGVGVAAPPSCYD